MKKITYSVIACVVLIIGLTVYLNYSKNPQKTYLKQTGTASKTYTISPDSSPVMIPFDYKVMSISTTEIILDGQKGKMTLPNDTQTVQVFSGPPEKSTSVGLLALKVGQKVKLEVVPGKSAKVFIIQ